MVSLVPSLTETLFAIGAGGRVVGVTRFCTEPPDSVKDIPRVGGTKDVDVTAVIDLAPDLVIANAEENEREHVEALIATGLPVVITFPVTVRQAVSGIQTLVEITGSHEPGDTIAGEAERELELVEASSPTGRRPRVFCPVWRRPWMAVGPGTYADDLIRVCGGENAFGSSSERYPETTLDEVAELEPDVILLPDEPYPFAQKHRHELIALDVPAARTGRIYVVDGKDMFWYGPRIPGSLRRVRRVLQGDTGV
jgi:ABC-type hemin transport system substrate-binding protein